MYNGTGGKIHITAIFYIVCKTYVQYKTIFIAVCSPPSKTLWSIMAVTSFAILLGAARRVCGGDADKKCNNYQLANHFGGRTCV